MGGTRPFLIDTDTASDDAVALLVALRHPEARVEAITVVAGNVPLPQAVQNALYTVELAEVHAPVFAGAEGPLERALQTAQNVHGEDGMGDIGLPLAGRRPAPGHAVDVLVETAARLAGELTLVTLGPLTNVALALRRAPELAAQVRRCVVMGGTGAGPGNVTPVAEYNVWADPEAARAVVEAGLPLTLVGWDVSCASAVIDAGTARRLRGIGTPRAHFAIDIQGKVDTFSRSVNGLDGFDLPDPIAMAIALEPGMATTVRRHVAVEDGDGPQRGRTVLAGDGPGGAAPDAEVVTAASRERFLALLEAALR